MRGKLRLKRCDTRFYKILRYTDSEGRIRDKGMGSASEREVEELHGASRDVSFSFVEDGKIILDEGASGPDEGQEEGHDLDPGDCQEEPTAVLEGGPQEQGETLETAPAQQQGEVWEGGASEEDEPAQRPAGRLRWDRSERGWALSSPREAISVFYTALDSAFDALDLLGGRGRLHHYTDHRLYSVLAALSEAYRKFEDLYLRNKE